MILLYTENPSDVTRKPLELMNHSHKVLGHKIITHKYGKFLYTNHKLSERESKKIISFKITTKIIGMNQDVKRSIL